MSSINDAIDPQTPFRWYPGSGMERSKAGLLLAVLLGSNAVIQAVPNGYAWGCLNVSKNLPFCDYALPMETRTQDLVKRLSLREKVMLLGADTKNTKVGSCDCMDGGVERLGIPRYMNLVEANSAVAAACLEENKCATNYPGPTGLAASFNRTGWRLKGEAIATEMRALNNLNWYRGVEAPYSLISLSGYGPNINIERDPRFGRNSELPGEDPFLSGTYAIEYVKGMQEGPDQRYYKMVAGLKHFDAYSVEDGRRYRMFNISMFDLWDTYLRQYKYGFHPDMANAGAAMCSYSGVNGVPSCANDYLQNQVVRDHWKRPDALIVSDCGAVHNMYVYSHYASSPEDAAAKSLVGGMDVELGGTYFSLYETGGNDTLIRAVQQGLVSEERISESVSRVILNRMRVGLFDPLEIQPYTMLGRESVNSTATQALLLDLTLQSLVLLKNEGHILPLHQGVRLALVGPHVNTTRELMEDYAGDQFCIDGTTQCIPTIGETFRRLNGEARTFVAPGVGFTSNDTTGIPQALEAIRQADVVILLLGNNLDIERETVDRPDTKLAGIQASFAQQVLAEGKPVVLVLINGGIISIDSLVKPCRAIVEAFNPSRRGAEALYLSLFGQANRWGRLPVTVYPEDYTSQVDMLSFDMAKAPGRTYRYYMGQPLFEFGQGMSYSPFEIKCKPSGSTNAAFAPKDVRFHLSCTVMNHGSMAGDEVVMLFHSAGDSIRSKVSHPVPHRTLIGFERVSVPAGESAMVEFDLSSTSIIMTDENGDQVIYAGHHDFQVFDGVTWLKTAAAVKVLSPREFKTIVEVVPKPAH